MTLSAVKSKETPLGFFSLTFSVGDGEIYPTESVGIDRITGRPKYQPERPNFLTAIIHGTKITYQIRLTVDFFFLKEMYKDR